MWTGSSTILIPKLRLRSNQMLLAISQATQRQKPVPPAPEELSTTGAAAHAQQPYQNRSHREQNFGIFSPIALSSELLNVHRAVFTWLLCLFEAVLDPFIVPVTVGSPVGTIP